MLLSTRASVRGAASSSTPTSTLTSMSRRWWRSARRGDADDVQSCRAGGGSHFDKLIRQQGGQYDSTRKYDETEAALHAFWLSRGVKEEEYRSRLVGMGANLASSVSAGERGRGEREGTFTSHPFFFSCSCFSPPQAIHVSSLSILVNSTCTLRQLFNTTNTATHRSSNGRKENEPFHRRSATYTATPIGWATAWTACRSCSPASTLRR